MVQVEYAEKAGNSNKEQVWYFNIYIFTPVYTLDRYKFTKLALNIVTDAKSDILKIPGFIL